MLLLSELVAISLFNSDLWALEPRAELAMANGAVPPLAAGQSNILFLLYVLMDRAALGRDS